MRRQHCYRLSTGLVRQRTMNSCNCLPWSLGSERFHKVGWRWLAPQDIGSEGKVISKKIFRLGWMAQSEWTRSIIGVRDTSVADYHHPIAVWMCLRILSVSNFKRSLWSCGQLWHYVKMVTLGSRLHQDYNSMGDAANISPRVCSTCAPNAILSLLIIYIIPSCQMYEVNNNPSLVPSVSCLTTHRYLWNHVRAAKNISHAENLRSNGCGCFSHLYKFWDRIQVTRVFRYCGERQG
jgi:hypothetical protein